MKKTIYYFGLGKMGKAMVQNLHEKGWSIVGYDVSEDTRNEVRGLGIMVVDSVEELFEKREGEMTIWFQIPYTFLSDMLDKIEPYLQADDTIVDAGNSPFRLAIERSERFSKSHVDFMDVGISGGVEGARNGACLMIGGTETTFKSLERLFRDISRPEGYQYLGRAGSGHYVKMVHNGIEYSMMQGIAEGFDLMNQSEFDLDLQDIVRIYQQESIVTSRLIGWLGEGFDTYGVALDEVQGSVGALGEGLWTIETAHAYGIKMPALEAAYATRIASQAKPTYRGKLLQTMRQMFGGHVGVNKIQS